MHDADVLAVVRGAYFGREGNVDLFRDGQRVHVGAQRDDRAGLATAQHTDDAGVGDAGPHLDPEGTQVLRDEIGGPRLAIGELGMGVDVTPPGHDLPLDLRGTAVDFRVEPAGLGVQRGGYANGDERQEYWAHGLKLANLRNASTGWAFSYLFSHTNILVPQLRVRADKLGHHADAGRVLTHLE